MAVAINGPLLRTLGVTLEDEEPTLDMDKGDELDEETVELDGNDELDVLV